MTWWINTMEFNEKSDYLIIWMDYNTIYGWLFFVLCYKRYNITFGIAINWVTNKLVTLIVIQALMMRRKYESDALSTSKNKEK